MNSRARAALRNLLLIDPQFVADMQALNLGTAGTSVVPKVLDGNRPFSQIGAEHFPCWVNDAGDMIGESASNDASAVGGLVIGSSQQDWGGDIDLSLIWGQQSPEESVRQTDMIAPALVRLLLRNPSLGETCTLAYVAEFQTDRNMRHPVHSLYARIRINTTIERDT